jgi:hypothetical protein
MVQEKLRIVNFAEYPGPRYKTQGPFSGEEFYIGELNEKFYDCYKYHKQLVIELDGTAGYPSSFLDEAFGELVYDFSIKVVESIVSIETNMYKKRKQKVEEETYPQWEIKREEAGKVINTMQNKKLHCIDENGKDSFRITQI